MTEYQDQERLPASENRQGLKEERARSVSNQKQ